VSPPSEAPLPSTPEGTIFPALPFSLFGWIEEHRYLLRPPVGNKVIWQNQDFICMVVGGPNSRTDYHVEAGPEFFYQLEGNMVLRIRVPQPGKAHTVAQDIAIKAGEIFLLPANVAHSPQRAAGSVGLVIERKRLNQELDSLQWYCQNCGNKIYQEDFHLSNIETQFKAVFERFDGAIENRTCRECGVLHPLRQNA
jgi:3-hydroxyanthranilate 3,4-dioxygenase